MTIQKKPVCLSLWNDKFAEFNLHQHFGLDQKQDITINFYEGESKSIKDVTREDLLSIMEKIYECPENYRLNKPEELNELKNDLVKAIGIQILQALEDFTSNVEFLKNDIDSAFPELPDDILQKWFRYMNGSVN